MELIVNEIFTSIQGEGINTGIPTTFIRLAGCDMGCKWCDTEYALETDDGESIPVNIVLERIKREGTSRVCITGGEPLIQMNVVLALCRLLLESGYHVDIETNGAHRVSNFTDLSDEITMSVDVKMPSSGEYNSFDHSILENIRPHDQIKMVILDENDLDRSVEWILENQPGCEIILTPCSNCGASFIVERILNIISQYGNISSYDIFKRIRIMIQTHKVIWGRDERGV